MNDTLAGRSSWIFAEDLRLLAVRTDRMFSVLMLVQWAVAIIFAFSFTQATWTGAQSSVNIHIYAAIFLGGMLSLFPIFLVWREPGARINRHVIALAQMAYSALLVHLTGGRIETHFHIFGSLAFLSFYKDREVLVTATGATAFDHIVRGMLWPASIYGTFSATGWRALEHIAWVVFEDVFLFYSIHCARVESRRGAYHQAELEETLQGVEEKIRERTAELSASNEIIVAQQNSLVESAKTSALGEMAGQIAHEINTPLGAIVLTAQGLVRKAQHSELTDIEVQQKMDFILQVTNKLSRIVGSMRKLAGHGANEQMSETPVKTLIDDVLLLCEGRFRKNGIHFRFESHIGDGQTVQCRANEIGQVLVNLLNNANDAVMNLSEKWIRLDVTKNGERLSFRVTDSGRGLSESVQERLFTPKFSTKTLDEGTGFGLTISKRLVEQHCGQLYFDRDCKNTAFAFDIPIEQTEALAKVANG